VKICRAASPHFAAFVLLDDDAGRAALSDLLGYSREALDGANNAAIELRAR
jgi:hypothetical protein